MLLKGLIPVKGNCSFENRLLQGGAQSTCHHKKIFLDVFLIAKVGILEKIYFKLTLILINISIYFIENRKNHSMCLNDLVSILIKKDILTEKETEARNCFCYGGGCTI